MKRRSFSALQKYVAEFSATAIVLNAVLLPAVSAFVIFTPTAKGVSVTPTCNGLTATITSGVPIGGGWTLFMGTLGDDVIVTGNGKNRVFGLTGEDTICTGNGTDEVNGGFGDDWISTGN